MELVWIGEGCILNVIITKDTFTNVSVGQGLRKCDTYQVTVPLSFRKWEDYPVECSISVGIPNLTALTAKFLLKMYTHLFITL